MNSNFDYDICIYLRFNFLADIEAAVEKILAKYLPVAKPAQTDTAEISLLKSLNTLWNGKSKSYIIWLLLFILIDIF